MTSDNSITEEEINTWISTLDTNSTSVKRVLGAIQILDSVLLTKILFYMVRGYMDISKLYTMDINNLSIKALINSLEQNTYTDIDKVYFYRDKIKNLPNFKVYTSNMKLNTTNQITRETSAINRYITQVSIDVLGFSESKYSNVNVVKSIYDNIINDASLIPLLNDINSKSNILVSNHGYVNLPNFTSLLLNDVKNYYLIYTNNDAMPLKLTNKSIITWIMRKQYLDVEYINFLPNFNTILKSIASDYDNDNSKLGIDSLKKLNLSSKISDAFSYNSYNDTDSFYNILLQNILLKVVIVSKVYGITYFDQNIVDNIKGEYQSLINYFISINTYINKILSLIKTNFTGS